MTDPATIVAAHGITYEAPQWTVVSSCPVEPQRFGKDHYSLLLYIESRAVDHRGALEHDHMRCDADRHPMLALAGRRATAGISGSGRKYPTRLRRDAGGDVVELADHDDYDCGDDLVAAGWATITMPAADFEHDCFRDQWGRAIALPGEAPIRAAFFTGLDEHLLARKATWALTDEGRRVCNELRHHKSQGGNLVSFADTWFGKVTA